MNNFKISYHNVDLDIIQKNLNDNKKKVVEINQILSDLISLTISNKTTDLNEIKNVANKLTENKDTFVVFYNNKKWKHLRYSQICANALRNRYFLLFFVPSF